MTAPTVSVLMPAFNAAHTLVSAIGSTLRQSWRKLELIVVNDGSTDNTAAILAACAKRDGRIRVIERENGGIVAALNEGWQACTGEYIARMDADDYNLPWRLARQIAYMESHRDISASGTAILPFQSAAPFIGLPARFPDDEPGIRTRLLFNPPIMHPTAMVRRALLGDEPPYSATMPQAEDYELWSRLAPQHHLGNIPTICLLYRRSATSISNSRRDEQVRQAGELRLQNLRRELGDAFAATYAAAHVELMARRYRPEALVANLPDYVNTLLAATGISRAVVDQVWFSYCLGYARTGGDGVGLFRQVDGRRHLLRTQVLALRKALQ